MNEFNVNIKFNQNVKYQDSDFLVRENKTEEAKVLIETNSSELSSEKDS